MKLLLTSVFTKTADQLSEILSAPPKELTVAFVPTAADIYDDKWFVGADRAKLVEMGFNVFDLSLKGKTMEAVEEALDKTDIIFVAGGNTFYLLEQARASGFIDLVPKLVERGVIYIGSSAGSYLACPTIEVATWKHQDRNAVGLTDFTALGLVPFLMSVHYKPEYKNILKQHMVQAKYQVKILTDDQAVLVIDNNYQLVGKGGEVRL